MISADLLSTATVLKYRAPVPLFEITWICTSNLFVIVIPPPQILSSIGRERVTCTGSKLRNNNLNFRLARDQVMHLETRQTCQQGPVVQNPD